MLKYSYIWGAKKLRNNLSMIIHLIGNFQLCGVKYYFKGSLLVGHVQLSIFFKDSWITIWIYSLRCSPYAPLDGDVLQYNTNNVYIPISDSYIHYIAKSFHSPASTCIWN